MVILVTRTTGPLVWYPAQMWFGDGCWIEFYRTPKGAYYFHKVSDEEPT